MCDMRGNKFQQIVYWCGQMLMFDFLLILFTLDLQWNWGNFLQHPSVAYFRQWKCAKENIKPKRPSHPFILFGLIRVSSIVRSNVYVSSFMLVLFNEIRNIFTYVAIYQKRKNKFNLKFQPKKKYFMLSTEVKLF